MNSSQKAALKYLLRLRLRRALSVMNPSLRLRKSRVITSRVLRTSAFKKAKRIFAYMATSEEVQTKTLLIKALSLKKEVYLPAVHAKNKMKFYPVSKLNGLRKGKHGIHEPRRQKPVLPHADSDLLIVPGLGFDRKGKRLGRGGGYYDRFLEKARTARKIGLAFREQMVREIPFEPHDQFVEKVITD